MLKTLLLISVLVGLPYGSKYFGDSVSNCGNKATYLCRDVYHYEHQEFYRCRDNHTKACESGNAVTRNRELMYKAQGCSVTYERTNMPNRWQLTKWYYLPHTCGK